MFTDLPKESSANIKDFDVMDCTEKDVVSFGIPNETEDQVGRLKVATDRYEIEGYLKDIRSLDLSMQPNEIVKSSLSEFTNSLPEEFIEEFEDHGVLACLTPTGGEPIKIYVDKYSWNSIPIVAKDSTGYIGSARLIIADKEHPLPMVSAQEIQIWPKYQVAVKEVKVEMSQLAKTKNSNTGTLLGLLRISKMYSETQNVENWVATIDEKVFKLLQRMCFDVKQVGDPVDYLGSISIPTIINIKNSIESVAKNSSPELAKFLDGEENVPGFEWYKGV
jgi:hypothetical protein